MGGGEGGLAAARAGERGRIRGGGGAGTQREGGGGGGRGGARRGCEKVRENSMQEARAQREREERKRKQAAVGRVDKRDNGVVVAAEVACKLRVGVGSTVLMFSLDM